jgi:hypothetical protein
MNYEGPNNFHHRRYLPPNMRRLCVENFPDDGHLVASSPSQTKETNPFHDCSRNTTNLGSYYSAKDT